MKLKRVVYYPCIEGKALGEEKETDTYIPEELILALNNIGYLAYEVPVLLRDQAI